MILNALQEVTIYLPNLTEGHKWQLLVMSLNSSLFAQTITDPDVVGSIQRAFDYFIQSGQVWALLIGLVIGYLLRGMTTYN